MLDDVVQHAARARSVEAPGPRLLISRGPGRAYASDGHSTNMEIDRLFALLAAHLSGIAPALRLVFDHVTDIIRGQELDCCSQVSLPPL